MSWQEFELDLADRVNVAPFVEHKLVPSGDFERNGIYRRLSNHPGEEKCLYPVHAAWLDSYPMPRSCSCTTADSGYGAK